MRFILSPLFLFTLSVFAASIEETILRLLFVWLQF